ncbi:MAG: hypothetical protein Q9203_003625 [Teloschistes exilis]
MTATTNGKTPRAAPAKRPINLSGHEKSPNNFMTPFGSHQDSLRSNPDVMKFYTPPTPASAPAPAPAMDQKSVQEPVKSENLRPIANIPKDLAEDQFSRVKYHGEYYWISREKEEDSASVGDDYVVVNKEDALSLRPSVAGSQDGKEKQRGPLPA